MAYRTSPISTLCQRQCLDRYRDEPDITSADPRYQSIFSSRPGYPWLAAPFIDIFGVLRLVSSGELVEAGSMNEARARGKVRTEGKDYVMADGDVVEFRVNV